MVTVHNPNESVRIGEGLRDYEEFLIEPPEERGNPFVLMVSTHQMHSV
jgi:hypothetical protein